jgi:hypothetical protein
MAVDRDHEAGVPTVTVIGEAVLRAEPDEATVVVTMSALADTPGPALAEVAGRSEALGAVLDELGVGAPDRATTGVTVYEEFDHTKAGRRSLGHRAAATVTVRLDDLEVISRLVMRATTELAAHVEGPRWRVAAENPVRLEAARQAAAAGRRKAEAYAEGLGARVGRLVKLKEPEDPRFHRASTMAFAASGGSEMPIDPGEQEIAATIELTFTLELSATA